MFHAAVEETMSWFGHHQGVTKRCRLLWRLIAPLYMRPNARVGVAQPMSPAVHKEPKYTLEISLHGHINYIDMSI
jgi:hypothetical protein